MNCHQAPRRVRRDIGTVRETPPLPGRDGEFSRRLNRSQWPRDRPGHRPEFFIGVRIGIGRRRFVIGPCQRPTSQLRRGHPVDVPVQPRRPIRAGVMCLQMPLQFGLTGSNRLGGVRVTHGQRGAQREPHQAPDQQMRWFQHGSAGSGVSHSGLFERERTKTRRRESNKRLPTSCILRKSGWPMHPNSRSQSRISKIASTSTEIFPGNGPIPTALRAPLPGSPNTSTIRSLKPLIT